MTQRRRRRYRNLCQAGTKTRVQGGVFPIRLFRMVLFRRVSSLRAKHSKHAKVENNLCSRFPAERGSGIPNLHVGMYVERWSCCRTSILRVCSRDTAGRGVLNLQPCVRIRRFPHWQRLQNVGDADKHRTGRIMLVKEISGRVGGTEEVESDTRTYIGVRGRALHPSRMKVGNVPKKLHRRRLARCLVTLNVARCIRGQRHSAPGYYSEDNVLWRSQGF